MGIDIGRLGRLYLGIESTPGTPATASVILPVREVSLQDKHEPIGVDYGSGKRYTNVSSVVGKRWAEGSILTNLDSVNAGYLLKLALHNEINTNVATGVYDHNFYPTVSGNTPLTATIYNYRGLTDAERISYATVKKLTLSFSDELVEVEADFLGKVPDVTGFTEPSLTVISGTFFSFRDASVKFGNTLTLAEAQSPTPVNSLEISISNDVEPIFGSGQGDLMAVRTKGFTVEGSYEVYFDNVEDRDRFRGLNKKAMIVQFTGIPLGGGYNEFVKLRIARLRINEGEVSTGLDDFYVFAANFVAEVDTSQVPNVFDIIVRNNKSSVY